MNIIFHPRKKINILSENDRWIKKYGSEDFDVTIGSSNGAGVCQIVTFLDALTTEFDISNNGLQGDNVLSLIKNKNAHQKYHIRKKLKLQT